MNVIFEWILKFLNGIDNHLGSPFEFVGIGLLIYYLIPDRDTFVSIIMIGLFSLAILRFILSFSGEDDDY